MARKKRRLKGLTQDDVIQTVEKALVEGCSKKWKTKQYHTICKKVSQTFLDEVGKHGTSRAGIIQAANAASESCKRYKDFTEPGYGDYFRTCERSVAGLVRHLAMKKPGLEGRRKR